MERSLCTIRNLHRVQLLELVNRKHAYGVLSAEFALRVLRLRLQLLLRRLKLRLRLSRHEVPADTGLCIGDALAACEQERASERERAACAHLLLLSTRSSASNSAPLVRCARLVPPAAAPAPTGAPAADGWLL